VLTEEHTAGLRNPNERTITRGLRDEVDLEALQMEILPGVTRAVEPTIVALRLRE
jgi:hypothetical protein